MKENIPQDIQYIKGVGPKRAEKFSRLDIENLRDLLYYFPREYEDRREVKKIKNFCPGSEAVIKGRVIEKKIQNIRKNLSVLRVTFSDDTGTIDGVWFNQNYLKNKFKNGDYFYLYGSLNNKSYKYNKKDINNPVYESAEKTEYIHLKRITPLYSLTSGLTQKRVRKIIFTALKQYANLLEDILPSFIRKKYNFLKLTEALKGLHFPEDRKQYIKAHQRLAYEELFLLQLLVLNRKQGALKKQGTIHHDPGEIINSFINSLPFDMTDAQKRSWQEIKTDMEKNIPMQRLLQGDVGSGKTLVAVLALIETMANGYQGVFMAPTEILAEQHYIRLSEMLKKLDFNITLLVGSLSSTQSKKIKEKISSKESDLIIGTHALFQEGISYSNVGLVVIDEQHRFGVEQRYSLKRKSGNPDLLIMTATPIPRSLALTFYGDLDVSLIDEMPPGRKPVKTMWYRKKSRAAVYNFVRKQLNSGHQAFVVCPLIEPSEDISALSAEETKKELTDKYLNNFNVSILHSQLSADEKKQKMKDFHQGNIDVLVSTTVIEVGVDVSNASVMVIEDAQRFGLAQLHQLRGRVGRGKQQSYCIVVAEPTTEDARSRLEVFTKTDDGFEIAEADLKIRGPGEFFGTEQHGMPDLKVASLIKDQKLLNKARKDAHDIIKQSTLETEFPLLYEEIHKLEVKI